MPETKRLPAVILTAGFVSALAAQTGLAETLTVEPGQLHAALSAAATGDTLLLTAGKFQGPFVIDRGITVRGNGDTVIEGGGEGTVITVDAPGVRLEKLTITGSGQRLSTEDSGIFITAEGDGTIVAGNTLKDNLIGVYLKGPADAIVRNNQIDGLQQLRVNERGNAVQLWNTPGSVVEGNQIRYGRDGIFVTTSRNNIFHTPHKIPKCSE